MLAREQEALAATLFIDPRTGGLSSVLLRPLQSDQGEVALPVLDAAAKCCCCCCEVLLRGAAGGSC